MQAFLDKVPSFWPRCGVRVQRPQINTVSELERSLKAAEIRSTVMDSGLTKYEDTIEMLEGECLELEDEVDIWKNLHDSVVLAKDVAVDLVVQKYEARIGELSD